MKNIILYMQKFTKLFLLVFLLQACESDCETNLENEIEDMLKSDNELTSQEFASLKDVILSNKDCYSELINEDSVNEEELLKLIKGTKVYRKLSKKGNLKINFAGVESANSTSSGSISPKLYLERSGSMVSYDSPQGDGDFRSVLTSLLTNLNSVSKSRNPIFIVNDNVYDSKLDFKSLVEAKDIFSVTNLGNSKSTDFDLIFRKILDDLKPGEVSILFSDLIFSTPSMIGVSNKKILDAAKKLTLNVFQGFSNDISVLVLKFNGDYNGKYFPHNQAPQKYEGQRPYYVVFFAKNETMNKFMSQEKYERVRDWNNYTNFENFYFFSNDKKMVKPFYTIRLKDAERAGSYSQESEEKKSKEKAIHSLEDIDHDKDGTLAISVLVDLSNLHIPEKLKIDINNYVVESNQNFIIDSVTEFKGSKEGTHKITLTTNTKRGGEREVNIRFKKIFPPKWIVQSQSTDDKNITSDEFSNTTFGILSMMEGINDAYDIEKSEYLFSLKINLKN